MMQSSPRKLPKGLVLPWPPLPSSNEYNNIDIILSTYHEDETQQAPSDPPLWRGWQPGQFCNNNEYKIDNKIQHDRSKPTSGIHLAPEARSSSGSGFESPPDPRGWDLLCSHLDMHFSKDYHCIAVCREILYLLMMMMM